MISILTSFHLKTTFFCVDIKTRRTLVTMVGGWVLSIICSHGYLRALLITLYFSCLALNRTDAKDTDINNIRDVIVDSLFSVFVTTGYYFAIFFFVWLVKLMTTGFFFFLLVVGTIPIIRCPRGNAAEMVAETLDKKIRDNLRDPRNSMFTGDGLNVSQLRYWLCR